MLCAPVGHCEDEELEVPAPKALDTKSWAANRGNPKTGAQNIGMPYGDCEAAASEAQRCQ